MSFRPFSLNLCRASFAGFLGLACAGTLHGEDLRPQPIEIVPLHGATIETNVDESQPAETLNLDGTSPQAPHPFRPATPGQGMVLPPPPRPQNVAPSERERDLLDRRRNWVFMTPEDLAGTDTGNDGEKNGGDRNATTAMQRYYEHLYDSDRQAATNQVGKFDPSSWTRITNSTGADGTPTSPFSTVSDPGIFQPVRADRISGVFGSDAGATGLSPEEVRVQAEQKAHMESFKQLWDIGQPAAAPVSASLPAQNNSAPIFGSSASGQPAFNAVNPSASGSSGRQNTAPAERTVSATRNALTPRPDFAPPQRAF